MDKESLIAFLRNSFGGMDFWALSKEWKEKYYKQITELLWQDHQIYRGRIKQLEHYITDNNLDVPEYDMQLSNDISF